MTAMPFFAITRHWSERSGRVECWRARRYRHFLEQCGVSDSDRILDVGAGRGAALERFNRTNPIVALDLAPQASTWLAAPNVDVVTGDGTRLPFADGEFPLVFSSSVIEHMPRESQVLFAAEIRRVGQRYFVQTPNRWFPIEPHYQLPLFQFLPRRARMALNCRCTLGWQQRGCWEEITLLSAHDLRRLFPGAEIYRERILGLTKSLMAIGPRG